MCQKRTGLGGKQQHEFSVHYHLTLVTLVLFLIFFFLVLNGALIKNLAILNNLSK